MTDDIRRAYVKYQKAMDYLRSDYTTFDGRKVALITRDAFREQAPAYLAEALAFIANLEKETK